MKKLIVANWKMNGSVDLLARYQAETFADADVVVCPPFPFLPLAQGKGGPLVGAQDCATEASGARTGEISARMLADFGARYCLVGHSERRQFHAETDAVLQAKMAQLRAQAITPIYCIGESQKQRDQDTWRDVLRAQLAILDVEADAGTIIAYEPVCAIGTGRVPTGTEIDEALFFVRDTLYSLGFVTGKQRVLYGGSADEKNAGRLLSLISVDGLLVGGASLDVARFGRIVESAADTNWPHARQ